MANLRTWLQEWARQPQDAVDISDRWRKGGLPLRVYLPFAPNLLAGGTQTGSAGIISGGPAGLRQSFASQAFRSRIDAPENTTRIVLAVASTNSVAAGERYASNFGYFSSSNYLCRVGQNGASLRGQFRSLSGVAVNMDAAGSAIAGRVYTLLGFFGGDGECAFYLDGALAASGSAGSLSTSQIGYEAVGNGRARDSIQAWDGHIYLAANLQGDYSQADAAELAVNPWALFAPRRIIVPVAAAASGGLPTLSNARVTSITTTTAVPLVDYAY